MSRVPELERSERYNEVVDRVSEHVDAEVGDDVVYVEEEAYHNEDVGYVGDQYPEGEVETCEASPWPAMLEGIKSYYWVPLLGLLVVGGLVWRNNTKQEKKKPVAMSRAEIATLLQNAIKKQKPLHIVKADPPPYPGGGWGSPVVREQPEVKQPGAYAWGANKAASNAYRTPKEGVVTLPTQTTLPSMLMGRHTLAGHYAKGEHMPGVTRMPVEMQWQWFSEGGVKASLTSSQMPGLYVSYAGDYDYKTDMVLLKKVSVKGWTEVTTRLYGSGNHPKSTLRVRFVNSGMIRMENEIGEVLLMGLVAEAKKSIVVVTPAGERPGESTGKPVSEPASGGDESSGRSRPGDVREDANDTAEKPDPKSLAAKTTIYPRFPPDGPEFHLVKTPKAWSVGKPLYLTVKKTGEAKEGGPLYPQGEFTWLGSNKQLYTCFKHPKDLPMGVQLKISLVEQDGKLAVGIASEMFDRKKKHAFTAKEVLIGLNSQRRNLAKQGDVTAKKRQVAAWRRQLIPIRIKLGYERDPRKRSQIYARIKAVEAAIRQQLPVIARLEQAVSRGKSIVSMYQFAKDTGNGLQKGIELEVSIKPPEES